MQPRKTLLALIAFGIAAFFDCPLARIVRAANSAAEPAPFTNSLGMRMIPIPAGTFTMGETNDTPVEQFKQPKFYLPRGDLDEHPAHQVIITQPFHMAELQVSIDQFRQFRATYKGSRQYAPAAAGISWFEAAAFCEWLGKRENKTYRLPTEAEWEYACRAGTTTHFSAADSDGSERPSKNTANAWGLKNMHTGVAEWCADWHGEYSPEPQTDPTGPAHGIARVIRGGGLDKNTAYYARSANRAGMPPNFPPRPLEELQAIAEHAIETDANTTAAQAAGQTRPDNYKHDMRYAEFQRDLPNNQGNSGIGFRVVCAPLPPPHPATTRAIAAVPANSPSHNLSARGIIQTTAHAAVGPDMSQPYFRKRHLLPTPPENIAPSKTRTFRALGLPRLMLRHNQSPGFEVCDNGDLLMVIYTSVGETTPDVALLVTRLRHGADQWDPPDIFFDIPDIDDHAPLLWADRENGRLWFFWGMNKYNAGYPFQYITSDDNGATWSPVQFPHFPHPVGGYSAQPITSAFRDRTGAIRLASDGIGPESVLWSSPDNGATWEDPGGRSGGRHTAFVELRDGRILGMGGKSSDIDGHMPRSISADGGKTWTISKTRFATLGGNQRPSLIRLASGRLLFAGDLQNDFGRSPAAITDRGTWIGLSDDEGETWKVRLLAGGAYHELASRRKDMGGTTVGYCAARQAPNGMIHLIASMTNPCLHYEFNEAWILAGSPEIDGAGDDVLMAGKAASIQKTNTHVAHAPDGRAVRYTAGIADDGRFLFHGPVEWLRPDGTTERSANYHLGNLAGLETLRRADGSIEWTRNHENGAITHTTCWPDNTRRTVSTWRNMRAEGTATLYERGTGKQLYQVIFKDGIPGKETGSPGEN